MMRCVLVLSVVAIVGCAQSSAPNAPVTSVSATAASVPANSVSLDVTGMTCPNGCAAMVKETLEGQPGVTGVKIDFAAKRAEFATEPSKFDLAKALKALDDAGFPSKPRS